MITFDLAVIPVFPPIKSDSKLKLAEPGWNYMINIDNVNIILSDPPLKEWDVQLTRS